MAGQSKAKTSSSQRWLKRQHSDPYVLKARAEGYRSRAVYKLFEIAKRDRLFHQGMTVVDLGAAPGGWSQVAKAAVGAKGTVIALDILPIEPLKGVDILQGDFRESTVLTQLCTLLKGKVVHLVISDMAPNLSGIPTADEARTNELTELAFDFASTVLVKGGTFLVKVFQGKEVQVYTKMLKQHFEQVVVRKPKASRVESREVYLLAKGYLPNLSI
jgi:23S rRNA (uridine2552-2'-O)-methyltransferase